MTRLPQPGGDNNTWGQVLNDYLSVSHDPSGALKAASDIASAKSKADSAVQSVNGVNGPTVTLAASDIDAEPAGLSSGTYDQLSSSYGGPRASIFVAEPTGNPSNDHAALQSAIDRAQQTGTAATVVLRTGTYVIDQPLTLQAWAPLHIIGTHAASTIKAADNAALSAVIVSAASGSTFRSRFVDFCIDGNVANGNSNVVGMNISAHTCAFEGLIITNCYDGLNTDKTSTDSSDRLMNRITRVAVSQCDHQGIIATTDSVIDGYTSVSEIATRSGGPGAGYDTCGIFVPGWGVQVVGVHLWGCNGSCITVNWTKGFMLNSSLLEGTYGYFVRFLGRANTVNISGNIFDDANSTGVTGIPFIDFENSEQSESVIVSDNVFKGNASYPRSAVIAENANCDYGFYHGNQATGSADVFADLKGANSIATNNMFSAV